MMDRNEKSGHFIRISHVFSLCAFSSFARGKCSTALPELPFVSIFFFFFRGFDWIIQATNFNNRNIYFSVTIRPTIIIFSLASRASGRIADAYRMSPCIKQANYQEKNKQTKRSSFGTIQLFCVICFEKKKGGRPLVIFICCIYLMHIRFPSIRCDVGHSSRDATT